MYQAGMPTTPTTLNVLIIGGGGGEFLMFVQSINDLAEYITDIGLNVKPNVYYCGVAHDLILERFGAKRCDAESTKESISSYAENVDIDIILDQNNQLDKTFIFDKFYEFQVTKSLGELTNWCESFLLGCGIPWSFSGARTDFPLYMRYLKRPGLCKNYFQFMAECTNDQNYTSVQQDKVRSITNRLSYVEYSRDMMHYYLIRLRKNKRGGDPREDFNFELSYHLSNYYFLIAGIMDSFARLINDIYGLKLPTKILALEKEDFINANRQKRTGLVHILRNPKFIRWASFLKERRNFIAHDSDMRQSPMIQKKDVLLTESETNELVDAYLDWSFAATALTPGQIHAWRAQVAQHIRLDNDYEEIARFVMVIPAVDGGHKIYQPLRGIDHDYEKLCDVMTKLLPRLQSKVMSSKAPKAPPTPVTSKTASSNVVS
jgi:hypothetical protein